ncbi:unnamed protein product, partial [Meganyctiphanes norvegica]
MVSAEMGFSGQNTLLVLLVIVAPSLQWFAVPRHRVNFRSPARLPKQKILTDREYYTYYHTPDDSSPLTPHYGDDFFSDHLINRLNKENNLPSFQYELNSQNLYDRTYKVDEFYDEKPLNNDNYYRTNFRSKKYNFDYQDINRTINRKNKDNKINYSQDYYLGNIKSGMEAKRPNYKRRFAFRQNNDNNYRNSIKNLNNRPYYQNSNINDPNTQFNHQRDQYIQYYYP